MAAFGLAVAGVGVASATTITPPSEGVTATALGSPALTLSTPNYTLVCYTFEASGETPASGGTVTLDQADVTVSNCIMNGQYLTDVDVQQDIDLVVDYNNGNPRGTLVIPDAGMLASYSTGAGTCDLTVNASDVGPVPYDNNTGIANAVNQDGVNFTSIQTGSVPCPSSGTALATTELQLELDGGGNPVVGP